MSIYLKNKLNGKSYIINDNFIHFGLDWAVIETNNRKSTQLSKEASLIWRCKLINTKTIIEQGCK